MAADLSMLLANAVDLGKEGPMGELLLILVSVALIFTTGYIVGRRSNCRY